MEEQKTKEVKMEVAKDNNQKHEAQHQKFTYEQLNDVCSQLYQENQKLAARLQQANLSNMFRRMDYLFLVLKYADRFDAEFVQSCTEELKSAISPRVEEEDKEEEEKEG